MKSLKYFALLGLLCAGLTTLNSCDRNPLHEKIDLPITETILIPDIQDAGGYPVSVVVLRAAIRANPASTATSLGPITYYATPTNA